MPWFKVSNIPGNPLLRKGGAVLAQLYERVIVAANLWNYPKIMPERIEKINARRLTHQLAFWLNNILPMRIDYQRKWNVSSRKRTGFQIISRAYPPRCNCLSVSLWLQKFLAALPSCIEICPQLKLLPMGSTACCGRCNRQQRCNRHCPERPRLRYTPSCTGIVEDPFICYKASL